jgi:8-oxo-dGTP diphosphatase
MYYDETHQDIINNNPKLKKKYKSDNRFAALRSGDLLGRVGENKIGEIYVSFWNTKEKDYELLDDCLKELLFDKKITKDTIISSPYHNEIKINQLPNFTTKPLSDEEIEHAELQRRLHLLRGSEKQDAMKKLGVGGRKDHPIQTALDKAGLRSPGQKWWALNSEWLSIEDKPITATIAVFNKQKQILIGTKKDGRKCLPGGHIEDGEETHDGALRELEEETGIVVNKLRRFGTKYFGSDADALFIVTTTQKPKAGSDLESVKWYSEKDVPRLRMVHNEIVEKAFNLS